MGRAGFKVPSASSHEEIPGISAHGTRRSSAERFPHFPDSEMKKTARHAIRELSLIFRNAALVTLAVVLGFVVGDALEFPVWAQGLFLLPAVLLAYRLSGTLTRRDGVLRNVAGMCKHSLAHSGGQADVGRMAARLGLSETVIRSSLLWLVQRGVIHIERWLEGDALQLGAGAPATPVDTAPYNSEGETLLDAHERDEESLVAAGDPQVLLLEQLAEVRAYRRFFQRVKLEELGLAGV